MKGGKRQIMKGIELPNQEIIGTFGEKKTYEYLEILKAYTIKQEKIIKEDLRRTRKGYSRNLIKGINTCVVTIVRYSNHS